MKIRPFQAIYPNIDFVASPDSFCMEAKTGFQEFKKNGLFKKTASDALYIFQIQNGRRTHTGLVAANDLSDFHEGRIKKHENTLSEKEQQQMQLFVRWQAILKPVLLVYRRVDAINAAAYPGNRLLRPCPPCGASSSSDRRLSSSSSSPAFARTG